MVKTGLSGNRPNLGAGDKNCQPSVGLRLIPKWWALS